MFYSPIIERQIMACIDANCNDFVNYTNWNSLVPYLVSKDLLDKENCEFLTSHFRNSREKGLKFYLEILPSKGSTAYSRFYSCIAEEDEHSGHTSLLELLDRSINNM